MNLELRDLKRKDEKAAIRYAIIGMHFDWYFDSDLPLKLYARYFWYLESNNATQVIAVYQDDTLAGVLLAQMNGETADGRYFSGTISDGNPELTAQGTSLTIVEKILDIAGSHSRYWGRGRNDDHSVCSSCRCAGVGSSLSVSAHKILLCKSRPALYGVSDLRLYRIQLCKGAAPLRRNGEPVHAASVSL